MKTAPRKHHMLRKLYKDSMGLSKEVTATKLSGFNLLKNYFLRHFQNKKVTRDMQENILIYKKYIKIFIYCPKYHSSVVDL